MPCIVSFWTLTSALRAKTMLCYIFLIKLSPQIDIKLVLTWKASLLRNLNILGSVRPFGLLEPSACWAWIRSAVICCCCNNWIVKYRDYYRLKISRFWHKRPSFWRLGWEELLSWCLYPWSSKTSFYNLSTPSIKFTFLLRYSWYVVLKTNYEMLAANEVDIFTIETISRKIQVCYALQSCHRLRLQYISWQSRSTVFGKVATWGLK